MNMSSTQVSLMHIFRKNAAKNRQKIGKKPYKCEQCLSNFAEKRNLKRHELIHSGIAK